MFTTPTGTECPMTVTVTSTDDSYTIVVDDSGTGGDLCVLYGTTPTVLLRVEPTGLFWLTEDVVATGKFEFNHRSPPTSGAIMDFVNHSNQWMASIHNDGRWLCGPRGACLAVEGTTPTDSPDVGTTRTVSNTTLSKYGLAFYSSSGWRFVSVS